MLIRSDAVAVLALADIAVLATSSLEASLPPGGGVDVLALDYTVPVLVWGDVVAVPAWMGLLC